MKKNQLPLSFGCALLLLHTVLGDGNHSFLRTSNHQSNPQQQGKDEPATTQRERALIWRDIRSPTDKHRWMGELGDLGLWNPNYKVTLQNLVLPGSHDAAAVDFHSDHCRDEPLLDRLNTNARRSVAQTQEASLWDQMYLHGMRFLDVRFDGRTWNGRRYPLQHTFYVRDQVDTLEKALDVINNFVTANPTEIVVATVRTNGCGGFHANVRTDIEAMIAGFHNLREMKIDDKDELVKDLQGIGLIDIQEDLVLEDYPGSGSDGGLEPENWFQYHVFNKQEPYQSDKFNVVGFFPAPSQEDLQAAVFLSWFHDGLEDWDKDFEQNMWMMHSALGQSSEALAQVNALFGDRVNNGGLFDVAWRLTLYKIFNVDAVPSSFDAVVPIDYINDLDEKFEDHCPIGSVLQGFQSDHDNDQEDRRWKTSCRFVDWINGDSQMISTSSATIWESCEGADCHHKLVYEDSSNDLINEFDDKVTFQFESGDYALTGFGGIHRNYNQDRRYWFYVAKVINKSNVQCNWTEYVNDFDDPMDFNTSYSQWIAGVESDHDNQHEDRRWKFYVCSGSS